MPILDNIHYKLLAFSMLDGDTNAALKNTWDASFTPGEAFWVDVKSDSNNEQIVDSVKAQLSNLGIRTFADQRFIVVYFINLRQIIDETPFADALKLPAYFIVNGHCKIPLSLVFGYIGGFASEQDKNLIKKNAKRIVELNNSNADSGRFDFSLVANSGLSEDYIEHWKGVILLCDILRRYTSPELKLPDANGTRLNNRIGFIRNAEYNETVFTEQEAVLGKLNRLLSDEGFDDCRAKLKDYYDELAERIRKTFVIDSRCLLVPNIPEPGPLRKTARRERLNALQSSIGTAVTKTQDRLIESVREYCTLSEAELAKTYTELLESSRLGIKLEANRDEMKRLFTPDDEYNRRRTLFLDSNWSEANSMEAVGSCLTSALEEAIWTAYCDVLNALYNYNVNTASTELEQRRIRLQEDKVRAEIELDALISLDEINDIILKSAMGVEMPTSGFAPIIPGGNSYCAVLCTDRSLYNGFPQTGIPYTVGYAGGRLDCSENVPIRALKYAMFDFDETRLNDLIK